MLTKTTMTTTTMTTTTMTTTMKITIRKITTIKTTTTKTTTMKTMTMKTMTTKTKTKKTTSTNTRTTKTICDFSAVLHSCDVLTERVLIMVPVKVGALKHLYIMCVIRLVNLHHMWSYYRRSLSSVLLALKKDQFNFNAQNTKLT